MRGQLDRKTYNDAPYDTLARLASKRTPLGEICIYTYDFRDHTTKHDWNRSTAYRTTTYFFARPVLEFTNKSLLG